MRDELEKVRIFDTTLRDGEQSPGATMEVEDKVCVARQLEALGVDVIEAGFAAASDGDFASVVRVADVVTAPVVLSLARTRMADIDAALKSVERAKRPGLHTFIATSPLHMQKKLQMEPDEVIAAAVAAVSRARNYVDHVEFSAEDASRSDPAFLEQVYAAVIAAGATVCNIPDTTGWVLPEAFGELVARLIQRVPGADQVIWSAHCHNDLGLAVANTLAAVGAGARQVECTINGIGERAGNASLEALVMAFTLHPELRCVTHVDTAQLYPTSRLVASVTGLVVPQNQPVVGDNAFAHEAGIHQDGVLVDKATYEIMRPESVGRGGSELVIGKHSGRRGLEDRYRALGVSLSAAELQRAVAKVKELADLRVEMTDDELRAIAREVRGRAAAHLELVSLAVSSATASTPQARVTLRVGSATTTIEAVGDGMVDACYRAINALTGREPVLERYVVKAITDGAGSLGEVFCVLRSHDVVVAGQGAHTDIVQASALAYVHALNKLYDRQRSISGEPQS